jgi:hypothetical protein
MGCTVDRLYAGASGTGRTTFVNTLCESEVLVHKVSDNPDMAHVEEGIKIKPVNVGTSSATTVLFRARSHAAPQSLRRMAYGLRSPSSTRPVLAITLTTSLRAW